MQEQSNHNLTPTIPTQDIFNSSSQLNQMTDPIVKNSETQTLINKPNGGGGKKFSLKIIFILLGATIFLLVLVLLVKTLVSNPNQSQSGTITWWSLEEDSAAVKPLIDEYKQKNPDVSIKFVSQSPQDYRERLANALAQGKGPDIFQYHNSWIPMFKSNLSPSTEDFSNSFYPVVGQDLKFKEGFYGIPLEYDGVALFINQDIFKSYGKNPPKTWDDLRKTAKDITILSTNGVVKQAGVALGVTSNVDYWQDILATLMLQNGASLNTPNTVNGQTALTYYTNFHTLDGVWNDTLPSSTTYFIEGNLGMYFGKYSDAFKIKKQNPNLHFSIVPLPQLPTDQTTIPSVSYASYFVNGVSKQSKNINAAWDFLKFLSTKESLQKLNKNETDVRGYGNVSPRVDMQNDLLSDQFAGAFVYQARYATSGYLYANTNDGATGINSQISKPFQDAVDAVNLQTTAQKALESSQTLLNQILANYGLSGVIPKATP